MRQIVVHEFLDEMQVHPRDSYRRLVDLSVASAQDLLGQQASFVEVSCVCGQPGERRLAFEKHGYTYWYCGACSSLYVSPRPTTPMLDWYALESPAAEYRLSAGYQESLAPHTAELAGYRTSWIVQLHDRMKLNGQNPIVDVETRLPGMLRQLKQALGGPLIAVKPLYGQAGPVDEWTVAADLSQVTQAKMITAFDVLESTQNPLELVRAAYRALMPGGLLAMTARCGSGFDILVLGQHATIFPLEHINLLTVEGVRALMAQAGFEIVELSTPGQLDVQLIERVLGERPDVDVPHFIRYFLQHRDRYAKRRLQEFLQENWLSSHLRLVARKPVS